MKRKHIYTLLLAFILLPGCNNMDNRDFMSVTTRSSEALDLYQEAYAIATGIVELERSVALYRKALEKDPEFFMARYQLATHALFHNNEADFRTHARAAIESRARLSKGEILLKRALESWLEDPEADVSTLGRQLAEWYPEDPDAWINLGFFYYMHKNYTGTISSLEKAMLLEDPDGIYSGPKLAIVPICMLGYTYMATGQMNKARTTFDDYILRYPGEQNPYDCMADYFMAIGEYDKAFDNYMIAFRMDTTHDVYRQRALNALLLFDHQGK